MPTTTLSIPTTSTSFARAALARHILRRPRMTLGLGIALALGFAVAVTPSLTAERWLGVHVDAGVPAPITVRVAPLTGADASGGGYIVARGDTASDAELRRIHALDDDGPRGAGLYAALFALTAILAGLFVHHARRSRYGRLVRVAAVNLAAIAVVAAAVKLGLLLSAVSILAVPVAVLALVPTLALDRTVGLATGILAALVVTLLVPFDVGVAIVLLAQVGVAGLVTAEQPKQRGRAVAIAGGVATACTALVYPLLRYLASGVLPTAELADPWRSAWLASALGPAIAMALALPLLPLYQRMVGEITRGTIYHLENRAHPLLRQIAERSPGSWQHSLAMASMAEAAADQIGADAQLVRVGAYFHDLGKSLQPKYFIENIEPGETSPHDQLPPEVSCAAIFEHVTEGIATARRSGLHERVVDFMHMHHGDGVLEYFWAKCREQGNPNQLTIDNFRYPGHPPQSRETAILAICDAVEAASRTLKSADPIAIDALVQRIVYGKLHLGQLDESGLAMADLRRIVDSLRDTIRHAHHGRDGSWPSTATTSGRVAVVSDTSVPLDSLDGPGGVSTPAEAPSSTSQRTPSLRRSRPIAAATADAYGETAPTPAPPLELAPAQQAAKRVSNEELGVVETDQVSVPAAMMARPTQPSTPPSPQPAAVTDRGTLIGTKTATPTAPTAEAPPRSATTSHAPATPRTSPSKPPPQPQPSAGIAARPGEPGTLDRATLPGTLAPPAPAPPVTEAPPRGARAKAATLPPPKHDRGPTVPPIVNATAVRASSTVPPGNGVLPSLPPGASGDSIPNINATVAGLVMPRKLRAELVEDAKPAVDDDTARTNPNLAAAAVADVAVTEAQVVDETPAQAHARTSDLERTNPRLIMPLPAPAASSPELRLPGRPWATGLAARIDRVLDHDDFGGETPVIPPTAAELRALLGVPDTTRKLSIDEVERLHAEVSTKDSATDLLAEPPPPRRSHHTTDVRDIDIEAAIELAPPARRTAIGVAKKKPEE